MDTLLARLRRAAPALTVVGFVMAVDLVFCLIGLVVDRRVITGAPAWLKPAKFALSTMIASWSFAYCIASLTIWPRFARVLDILLAAGLFLEIALIDMQAARGTTSHFNNGTHFDAAVYAVMGVSIACIWLSMLLLTVVLFRQPFAGSAWGWSLRLGMVLALFGTGSGGLMTMPSSRQLAEAHSTGRIPVVGAHTVGAPDGGRGLPVTGWSVEHGDLRNRALYWYAWVAGIAAVGLVDGPSRLAAGDAAASCFLLRCQLSGAFFPVTLAGFSRATDCAARSFNGRELRFVAYAYSGCRGHFQT